jgi:hypothetical protein
MNEKIEKYGFKSVERPKIKASVKLNLSGLEGKQIVKSETKLILTKHKKTFERLAHM